MTLDTTRFEPVIFENPNDPVEENSLGLFIERREAKALLRGVKRWQLWRCERKTGAILWERVKLLEEKP